MRRSTAPLSAVVLMAGILVMAGLAASTLAGRSGAVYHLYRLEAGHGPVATSQPAAGQSWWICAMATDTNGPCR
jgi:hypothetical protein